MKIGDLVTTRWGEGKRPAGMIVEVHYSGNEWIDEAYVEWFSEWEIPLWMRTADLELINENR